jgi:hypothetical protein
LCLHYDHIDFAVEGDQPGAVPKRTYQARDQDFQTKGGIFMRTNLTQLVWGFALSVCVCVPAAMAQTVTGSITGEVTDQSGAVVSGAKVTAHNLDTGVDTSAQTNSDGVYHIEFLPIGHYQVAV